MMSELSTTDRHRVAAIATGVIVATIAVFVGSPKKTPDRPATAVDAGATTDASSVRVKRPRPAPIASCPQNDRSTLGFSTSPDGRVAVVFTESNVDGEVVPEVWDLAAGKVDRLLSHVKSGVILSRWTDDGSRLALAGASDGGLGFKLYETTLYKPLVSDENLASSFPSDMTLSPDGSRVVVSTLLGVISSYEAKTGRRTAIVQPTALRAAGHISVPVNWSSDSKLVEVEGVRDPSSLRKFDVAPKGGEPIVIVQPGPQKSVAMVDAKGAVFITGAGATGQPREIVAASAKSPEDRPIFSLAFRPDGGAIAIGFEKGGIEIRELPSGKLVRELKGQDIFSSPVVECREILWSPDGKKIAVWTGKGGLDLWSVDDGSQTALIENQDSGSIEGKYTVMSFSPRGEMLQASTDDGVSIWTQQGQPVGSFSGNSSRELNPIFAQRGQISEARWSQDGKFLAIQAPDPGGVKLIRSSDGATISLRTVGADPGQLIARTDEGVFNGPIELENCALPTVTIKGTNEKPVVRATLLADFFEGRGLGR